jgi:hypothetical protein
VGAFSPGLLPTVGANPLLRTVLNVTVLAPEMAHMTLPEPDSYFLIAIIIAMRKRFIHILTEFCVMGV